VIAPSVFSLEQSYQLSDYRCDTIVRYQEKQTDPPPRALSEKAGKI
jgi:hypothetical protein